MVEECQSIDELIENSITFLKSVNLLKKDDEIIVVSGLPGRPGKVNRLEVKIIE